MCGVARAAVDGSIMEQIILRRGLRMYYWQQQSFLLLLLLLLLLLFFFFFFFFFFKRGVGVTMHYHSFKIWALHHVGSLSTE